MPPTKYDNLSIGQLADDYGEADGAEKRAKKRKDDIKAEFERRGAQRGLGDRFEISRSESTSSRLDTKALTEKFGEKKLAPFMKSSPVVSYRLKAVVQDNADA